MKIHDEVMLDYNDVLLLPQRNDIESRNDVILVSKVYRPDTPVVPIIAANMDHVGTFEMDEELAQASIMTALVKHYTVDEFTKFYVNSKNINYFIHSIGIGGD